MFAVRISVCQLGYLNHKGCRYKTNIIITALFWSLRIPCCTSLLCVPVPYPNRKSNEYLTNKIIQN